MTTVAGIVIVEDDLATREQLRANIDALAGFDVLADVGSVAAATEALTLLDPDVLLVDLGLPDGSGIDVIERQHDLNPALAIMVISVLGDERSVIRAIEAGAQGYLLKGDSSLALEASLTQLMAGGAPISAQIARHLIRRLRPVEPPDAPSILSERELEVLTLAAKGYNYQDIARLLDISLNTVSSYTRRTYQKLSVHSKSEAIFEAMRIGLVDKPKP